MSIDYSTLYTALLTQKRDQKCYPSVPYKPCPLKVHTPTEQGLFVSFKALPAALLRGTTTEETIWWTDAQFLPYSDCELVVTTTPYHFRLGQSWVPIPNIPAGRILLYNIGKNPLGCVNFKGTSSTALPTVHPHPLGMYIAYIPNSSGVKVINFDNKEVFHQPDTILGGACNHFSIAPNGINLATLFRGQGYYFLRINHFDNSIVKDCDNYRCHKMCQDFVGSRTFGDQVRCKWSADSKLVAVCSHGCFKGKIFVFELATGSNICTVCPDLMAYISTSANGFDFDPRPEYSRLAVATHDSISIVDVRKNEIVSEIDDHLSDSPIDSIKYNMKGTRLAVAYQDVIIRIFDPDTSELMHYIDMKTEDEKLQSYVPCHASSAIMNMCFNFTASLLATSACDGYVRVWQIPCHLSLQEFCKLEILRFIPINKVKQLNLPEKIKMFLLSP